MPQRNKSKRTYRRQNIVGNFRGSEDIFMKKVRDGFIKFLESPFKRFFWFLIFFLIHYIYYWIMEKKIGLKRFSN